MPGGGAVDLLALFAGLSGVAGSILLAVPIWRGLGDRAALDAALAEYRSARGQADTDNDEGAKASARDTYEAAQDTFLAEALGNYRSNLWWTCLGLLALFVSFGLIIVGALSA